MINIIEGFRDWCIERALTLVGVEITISFSNRHALSHFKHTLRQELREYSLQPVSPYLDLDTVEILGIPLHLKARP